ncbi:MAG TPA: cysteine peptidase family C39 domain-containing protein [Gemmataceae bacterium]|nr:cysteine peptidase family C39 domain-containing protein [Gemmataceae bacterium]
MLVLDIPYQRQINRDACGAAALAMIYESFGVPCSQEEIWPRTACPGPGPSARTKTWLLCADALRLGFSALTIKALDPWQMLRECAAQNIRAILNHRLSNATPAGHYSVLVAIDENQVVLHDPQLGPQWRLSRVELLDLWCRRLSDLEITGRVLLAVARGSRALHLCATCGCELPRTIACRNCRQSIPLDPTSLLGCFSKACDQRRWEQLFCPYCDGALLPQGPNI